MADRIDMSLDDIIKQTKKTRGRGGQSRGGRGASRGGRGRARGGGNRGSGGPIRRGRSARGRSNPYSRPRDLPDVWQHDMYDKASTGVATARRSSGRTGLTTGSHLQISNLDFGVTESDIRELFQEFGEIKSAALNYDSSGRSHGTADIVFIRKDDAVKAFKTYNGVPLDGRPMKIELVTPDIQVKAGAVASPGRGRGGNRGNQRQSFGDGNKRFGNRLNQGRGARGGRGGRGRGRGRGGKPVSKDQLDAELDAYKDKA
eukprot:gene9025-9993_t